MATIHKEVVLARPVEEVWAAVADLGGVNRLITSLGDVRVEGDHRYCSVGNGEETDELLITADPDSRRLVYSLLRSPLGLNHHNSAMLVSPAGSGSRLSWTTDFKPDELAPQMEQGYNAAVASIREVLG